MKDLTVIPNYKFYSTMLLCAYPKHLHPTNKAASNSKVRNANLLLVISRPLLFGYFLCLSEHCIQGLKLLVLPAILL